MKSLINHSIKILGAIALLFVSAYAYADCKSLIWKSYHQYITKGPTSDIRFKLKNIKSTTVWLNCSNGKPVKKILLKYSDNAVCKVVEAKSSSSLGLQCRYKSKSAKPCISVKLKCE